MKNSVAKIIAKAVLDCNSSTVKELKFYFSEKDWEDIMAEVSRQKADQFVDYKELVEGFRKRHHLSLREFSEASGIPFGTIHHIIYRGVQPSANTSYAIISFINKNER